eukprot:4032848-Pleurochrysis_carterae.AAC.1
MGRAVDISMQAIAEDGQLLLDQAHTPAVFAELERELPPLAKYTSGTCACARGWSSPAPRFENTNLPGFALSFARRSSRPIKRPQARVSSLSSSPLRPRRVARPKKGNSAPSLKN